MPTVSMCASIIHGDPVDRETLSRILNDHKAWLEDRTKGRQACLRGMDLENLLVPCYCLYLIHFHFKLFGIVTFVRLLQL